ncbi:MAG: DnaA/Hda family protein [Alphaproteobacteria bacterium]
MSQQLTLRLAGAPTYSMNDFLQAPCNQKAYEMIAQADQWPHGIILWGAEKTGKTHLAHIFQHTHGGEFYSEESIESLKIQDLVKPETYYILDQSIDFYTQHETELFHLLNLLHERNSKLLMTAHKPLLQWSLKLSDLQSRLSRFLSVELEKPDDSLLESVLHKHASDLQITLDPKVAAYLMTHSDRSIQHLLNTLEQINVLALERREKITIPLAKRVLEKLT